MARNRHAEPGECLIDIVGMPPHTAYEHACSEQVFEYLEFFAGKGNLSHVMKSEGYNTVAFDILYNTKPRHRKSNFMDLCHSSGYAFLC